MPRERSSYAQPPGFQVRREVVSKRFTRLELSYVFPLVANPVDAAALAEELARFRVIDTGRLTDLMAEFPGGGATALAGFLVRRGALNLFQAERALAGGSRWLNLGPYRLIGEANHGTFGPVYAALHRDNPGEFRLRMFPLRSLWRARQAKQIARALTAPPHPAVVPLVDADSANGLHYLVWPHAEGTPLASRVSHQRTLSIEETLGLLIHLTNALHSCHLMRVAHGTITPQSIVLGVDGIPQLLEHGAGAILAENLAAGESLLDTLSATVAMESVLDYAAPEFVASPGPPTPVADQYALGAVCYFALTGQAPYPAGTRTERLSAKLAGPPRPLCEANPAVPPPLGAVIDRMLRPDPINRFLALNEVRDRLAAYECDAAVTPAAVTLREVPSSIRERRRSQQPIDVTPQPLSLDGPAEPLSLDGDDEPSPPPPVHSNETLDHAASVTPLSSPLAPLPKSVPSPTSPVRTSPVTEVKAMAKLATNNSAGTENLPKPPKKRDPRTSVGAPFHYHTETPPDPTSGIQPGLPDVPDLGEPPVTDSQMWKRFKQKLLFWKTPTDIVQVSVFGPPTLTTGLPAKVSVYLHPPETSDSVHTLCRAFHHDAVPIGAGYISREVAREESVDVHISVANAGVTKSTLSFIWRGQPQRLVFDLHVPWESPGGPAPGAVSVGIDNVRIGKVDFRLHLMPRKS